MLLANFNGKEHLRHRAVSLRQHGFLVIWKCGILDHDHNKSVVPVSYSGIHDNVEAVKLYSKVDGGTLYFLPPFLSLPFPFLPSLPTIPLEDRSGPLNPAGRSVDSDVASGLKGGGVHENRTYRRPWRASLARNPGPSLPPEKKLNLGLAEVQFPPVLRAHLHLSVSS